MTLTSKRHQRKLAVFDIEGVLLPKNRYLTFEVGRTLSFPQLIKLLFVGLLYEARLLSLESALKRIFKLFRDFNVEELVATFRKVPLLPHVESVFARLKEEGVKTAIISSGLPQVVVENLGLRLKADYAFGLELETNNNILTGAIRGEVIKENGKALIMKKILAQEDLTPKDCVVIADDRNNLSIFYPDALKIGYNPDSAIILRSDYVVKENLLEILSILEGTPEKTGFFLSSNDVIRETIHASGFLVILAAMYFGTYTVALLLFLTVLAYAATELARIERKNVPLVSSITLNAATPSERYQFTTTPMFLALGIMLSLVLFPTPLNYASIAVVSLGDSAASIFGKIFGKTPIPFNKGKSLEGSLAGFAFAFLGAAFFLQPMQAVIGAIVGTLVETLPLPINDNISTPLATGAFLTLILSFS